MLLVFCFFVFSLLFVFFWVLDFLVCFFGFPLGFLGNHWDFLVLFVFLFGGFIWLWVKDLGTFLAMAPKIVYFKGVWFFCRKVS